MQGLHPKHNLAEEEQHVLDFSIVKNMLNSTQAPHGHGLLIDNLLRPRKNETHGFILVNMEIRGLRPHLLLCTWGPNNFGGLRPE